MRDFYFKNLMLLLLISCSTNNKRMTTTREYFEKPKELFYTVKENEESFRVKLERGKNKDKYFVRETLNLEKSENSNPLEKLVSIAEDRKFLYKGRDFEVIFPKRSVFTSWMEGKRLSSKIDYLEKDHAFFIKSPKGNEKVLWVDDRKPQVLCFFSQIIPCLSRTGAFLANGLPEKEPLEFFILWEKYPYLDSFYSNVKNELFSPASLIIEAREDDHLVLTVEVFDQVLSYQVTNSLEVQHFLWVAQNISWAIDEIVGPK